MKRNIPTLNGILLTIGLIGILSITACNVKKKEQGEIAGSVTDIFGDPVRDAEILLDNRVVAHSSPIGTFVIRNVTEGKRLIKARLRIGGVEFRGSNHVVVFPFDRTNSVAIVVARNDQLGAMSGKVTDEFGTPLEGVRVFAGGPLNSWMDLTDKNGNYRMDDLVGGFDYTVTASGRGYRNDTDVIAIVARQNTTVNFRLRFSNDESPNVVTGLGATAWTSPVQPNRTRQESVAYEKIKRMLDPKRARRQNTRDNFPSNHVEIDLFWDYEFWDELLGYGIYRGTNQNSLVNIDFHRDPLSAFYADISDALLPGVTYWYAVTRLNTDAPGPGTESTFTEVASATPINDLILLTPFPSPPVFRWFPVQNADYYAVFVFPNYPDFQVDPMWQSGPVLDTNVAYAGPPLVSGRTYYYVVVASGFGDTSFSISQIDSFAAP